MIPKNQQVFFSYSMFCFLYYRGCLMKNLTMCWLQTVQANKARLFKDTVHTLLGFHFTTIYALPKCLASKTRKLSGSHSYQCLIIFARTSLTLYGEKKRQKFYQEIFLLGSRLFTNLSFYPFDLVCDCLIASFYIIVISKKYYMSQVNTAMAK